ncbi:MAG TPA: radical SAM protein [Myxococcota bacterium]|nr:radical SAM protein [Myxococcota bacterium]
METLETAGAANGESSHRTKGLLRLTMACNERCPFCNVPAEDYARPTPPVEEIDAQLARFLADGAETLTISGGEPTLLRKRLIALVRRAREGGVRFVELQTNAVLIDEAYARELAAAGVTSAFVSLLSHVPEHHDRLAGLPGAWPRCLRGIDALLDAGVRVTLNPVTARLTQALVPDYIDFVAERLPRVRFVSMSAVQPHGRARDDHDLLPDYDVLGASIREARARARARGIELVNPYCGLPLCVGWDDDLGRSVEAFEAEQGGWRDTPGLDNVGNKSHGPPCRGCALRTRCGGAWHAYWELRGGAGVRAPAQVTEPWEGGEGASQTVLEGPLDAALLAAAASCGTPTVWWWARGLAPADVQVLHRARVTDLALDLDTVELDALRPAMVAVRQLLHLGRDAQPQQRLRVVVALRLTPGVSPAAVLRAASLVAAVGVDGVRLLGEGPRWARLAGLIREQRPGADVTAIEPRVRDTRPPARG